MFDLELDGFKRDINLVEYAERECGYKRVPRESSRSSVVLQHPATDDKLIVARDRDDHWIYFSVRDTGDNGTIIDFVQRRKQQNLGEIRKELRDWLRVPRPDLAGDPWPQPKPMEKDRHAVAAVYAGALERDNNVYLNSRGLRPATLREPRFRDTWKEDARGNVLFVHRDHDGVTGFEVKNAGFTGFAAGGTKSVWHSEPGPNDNKLVITESAIDALSYSQLHPQNRTRYLSTGGQPGGEALELVSSAMGRMPPGGIVVAATDCDKAGIQLAQQLERLAARHTHIRFVPHFPDPAIGKDWNEVLQRAERDYIRSLGIKAPSKGLGR